jgi:light-regulated signal transduction histidine kinase (bacteriophytochrome)
MMPRMDGVALLQALRSDPRTSTVPVVLLSARAGEEAIVAGLETGADDYLVKPFSARELMSRVATHLEMARVRRVATDVANELAETRAALLNDVERKNQELEAFSYSVSHDLRAPLRGIDGFSQALLEDYGSKLDAKAQDYLLRVRTAAQRMGDIIDDLLRLSRVERTKVRRQRVDLSRMAEQTIELLRKSAPARNVDVVVRQGVEGDVDAGLFLLVFENLLANAWKFTMKSASPTIEFGSVLEGARATLFIRDNGVGFNPAYAGKLFAAFQRLHSDEEFPGTGIGLAIVQRVVHRHGGRIWAEGAEGQGATFYFTLSPEPRSQPPDSETL